MNMTKKKLSFTDWSFRIPGYLMLLGWVAEYDFVKSGLGSPSIIIGDKTIPVFTSLGWGGIIVSLLPYIIMAYNAWKERK
jgi:hypothetical protein